MSFRPKFNTEGKTVLMPIAASQTIVKGDSLADNGSGLLAVTSSSTATPVTHVAMEGSASAAAGTLVLCVRTTEGVFEADCDAAPAQTDVGTYADLATKATINPDASTHDLFYIEKIIGAVGTSTVVEGHFAHYVPNS